VSAPRSRRLGRRAFTAGLVLAAAVAATFLLLPLLAIFLRVPLGDLAGQLGSNIARDAIVVTIKTTVIAQALILLIGTPAAYLVANRSFRGRTLAITLVELPLVLPPAVAGLGLLAAFGRLGLLGGTFGAVGITVAFTQVAVVLAVAYVASPFYLRQAIATFEGLDRTLLDASRTLGAGPARTFWRVALPLAARGLGAGAALSFARGIGEFGATIMFAGSLQGVTQTLSLAIYAQFDVNLDVALALGALLVVASAAVLITAKLLPVWTRSRSTSHSRAATSWSI
jgi:molybdate transport system permease protein